MNEINQYVDKVMRSIHAPAAERQRIEADLRAHLEEAVQAGQAPRTVVEHMGSPLEVAAAFMSDVKLEHAGFWPRLLAFAVDMALLIAGMILFGGLAQLFISLVVRSNLQPLDWVLGTIWLTLSASSLLLVLGLILLYFPIMEGRFGQTPGKRVLGLHVLQENGLPIGYKEALLRRIPFYFEFIALDALFIPFTAKKQRAFDIVARTIVVKEGTARTALTAAMLGATVLVVVVLVLVVVANPINAHLAWTRFVTPGEVRATYLFFNGVERQSVDLQAGQVLELNWNATIRNGSVEFQVTDPSGRVVSGTTVGAPHDGWLATVGITAQQSGRYTILVKGNSTGGAFDVNWKTD